MIMFRKYSLYFMSAFYITAGIMHFIRSEYYTAIMPPYLPWHMELVYISGVCESLLGILLLPAKTRRIAAWLIIALLIAVFPANIQMTINYANENNPGLWYTIVRLPIQILLIWWAWIFTKKQEL